MVIRETDRIKNYAVSTKFGVAANTVRHWLEQKNQLLNSHSTRKLFHGLQTELTKVLAERTV